MLCCTEIREQTVRLVFFRGSSLWGSASCVEEIAYELGRVALLIDLTP